MRKDKTYYIAHRGKIRSQVLELRNELVKRYRSNNISFVAPYYDLNQNLHGWDLVNQDIGTVWSCDGVIAIGADLFVPNAEPFNQGGIIEYTYGRIFRKPVFIITKREINHPFVGSFATVKFESIEEFITHFDKYIGSNNNGKR